VKARTPVTSLALVFLAACGGADKNTARPARSAPLATSAIFSVPTAPADPLGPAPPVAQAPPFQPPAPVVYTAANGMTVWLLERHALPLVAVTVAIPTGSSSDPEGKAGLAYQSARILREGAGKRGALELARAVDDLGASLDSSAGLDVTRVGLEVVKRNFAAGLQLLGDVVVRPRLDPVEWKRLHDLWLNELMERGSEPEAVASVVEGAVVYGTQHPYGHPVDGFASTAPKVDLADAKRFIGQAWRPDRATVVVAGDVTRAELDAQLDAAFGGWKAPASAPLPIVTPAAPVADAGAGASNGAKPKVVFVDRADAPQAVVKLVRPSLDASDPRYPPLYRANIAIGGSFTSRLMQDLREAHGWTYGAKSIVTASRGIGVLSAGGAFVTEKSVDALNQLLVDLDAFARDGLTEEETTKTRLRARSEIVDDYQTVAAISFALAHDAALGLGPEYEAKASSLSDDATRSDLSKLAATFYGQTGATVIVVGPRATLEGQLVRAGYGPIEYRDAEGTVLKDGKAAGTKDANADQKKSAEKAPAAKDAK
jgi:zinc protease